jgi:hypothetical protein
MVEAAAAAAAIAQAIKASGAIVRVEPQDFARFVARQEAPLVVHARGGVFRKHYQYLTSYRGFVFFTKSREPLPLPGKVELVAAGSIWVPQ